MENITGHQIIIENKGKITITDALEVLYFDDKQINVKCKNDLLVVVVGSNLKIVCFKENGGGFTACGNIDGVKYKVSAQSIVKKVFK